MRTALLLAIALFTLAGCGSAADEPQPSDDAVPQGEVSSASTHERKVQIQQPRSTERVDPSVLSGGTKGDKEHILPGVE